MKSQSWRDRARPIIAEVLRMTAGKDENIIRAALFDAYPFGERKRYPYHIWLDEIQRQRKMKRTRPKTKDGRLLVLDTKLQDKLF
jgi:hypothetical protein